MTRDRWFLDEPFDADGNPVDARTFTAARPANVRAPLEIPVDEPGPAVTFTLGAFDMPVVSKAIGDRMATVAPDAVQRIPSRIRGARGEYETLNVLHEVDCLDEARSALTWWTAADGRPDKIGTYRMVRNDMTLRAERVVGRKLFRIQGRRIALIASEEVKHAFEEVGVTGIKFRMLDLS